eukprot:CAMPEP_0115568552 /NCGR_PEP_ID=MMETSP0271-20121206/104733_1 /TAXON_ID=71861 /ORGANISM="Scrippsiella trochoidea, Strain CCMP3099" /LENGTH=105 /DNA_ID=CAMNT_0003003043 /DNA_START=50 /DNA_END=363 /DNA_ORIENTATION=-
MPTKIRMLRSTLGEMSTAPSLLRLRLLSPPLLPVTPPPPLPGLPRGTDRGEMPAAATSSLPDAAMFVVATAADAAATPELAGCSTSAISTSASDTSHITHTRPNS